MSMNDSNSQIYLCYEMAEQELRKLPQFRNSLVPIPVNLIWDKVNEYSRLSSLELQAKINEYFFATKENDKDGWQIFGLELSGREKEIFVKNEYEKFMLLVSPDTAKTKRIADIINLNQGLRSIAPNVVDVYINERSEPENEALRFLDDMFNDANKIFEQQLQRDNWVIKGYNALIKETFSTEYAQSNVQQMLDDTKSDVISLKTTLDFRTTFMQTRGVKFDPEKVKITKQKAEAMARYQASTDLVKNLKRKLATALSNITSNNINRTGEEAILETLAAIGYTKIGDVIQVAMMGHENSPDIKEAIENGGFVLEYDKKTGKPQILRGTKEGGFQPITQEMAQIIGKEINLRLNKIYAESLGISEKDYKNLNSEQLEELTTKRFNDLKEDYEQSFSETFGEKDLKILSQNFMLSQQEGQAYIQAGFNFIMMGLAMFSGGTTALLATGAIITDPIGLIAKATDYDGMTRKDWEEYGQGVLEQAGWMALGMGAGKIGDMTRSFVKVKGLSAAFKQSGQSVDDFLKTVKMTDVPPDIAKTLRKVKIMSETLGVTAEVATDLATTYMLQKDGATTQDWIMSVTSTIAGTQSFKTIMQKVRVNHSNPTQMIKEIKDTFSAIDLTDADAVKLIETMKKIESEMESQNNQSAVSMHKNEQINHINQPDEGIQTLSEEYNEESIRKAMKRFSKTDIDLMIRIWKENPNTTQQVCEWFNMTIKDADGNNIPRFDDVEDIERLIFILNDGYDIQTINKYVSMTIKDQDGNEVPRFGSIREMHKILKLRNNESNKALVDKYLGMTIKDENGNDIPKFKMKDIQTLIELQNNGSDMVLVTKYLDITIKDQNGNDIPKLSLDNIKNLLAVYQVASPELRAKISDPSCKFLNVITEETYVFFENPQVADYFNTNIDEGYTVSCIDYPYLDNNYIVTTRGSNGLIKKYNFSIDNVGNVTHLGKETEIKKADWSSDVTLLKYEFADGRKLIEEIPSSNTGYKKTLYDSNGVQVYSEVMARVKKQAGVYTINVYERGFEQKMRKKQIGILKTVGDDKICSVELQSGNGITTTQNTVLTPYNSQFQYEIRDENSNVLFSSNSMQTKIDDHHYTTCYGEWNVDSNGNLEYLIKEEYDIEFNDNKITVCKMDGQGNKIETITLGEDLLDFRLIDTYKQLPGDYFFKIKKAGIVVKFELGRELDSYSHGNTIVITGSDRNRPFVFAHEFGHVLDNTLLNNLSSDSSLREIFDRELRAFKNITSDKEGHVVDYFTIQRHYAENCLKEVVAEGIAILSGYMTDAPFIGRTITLQRHFPETIAYIAKKVQEFT